MGVSYEVYELSPIVHKGLLIELIIEKTAEDYMEMTYLHLNIYDYETMERLYYKLYKTSLSLPLPAAFRLSSLLEEDIKNNTGYELSKEIYRGIFNSIFRELEY